MLRKPLPVLAALLISLAGAAQARGIDVDKVNGSIHIEGNQQAGNLETVNGSIRVEDGGSAEDISASPSTMQAYITAMSTAAIASPPQPPCASPKCQPA